MRSEEAVVTPAGQMGINSYDLAEIRKARMYERTVAFLRPIAYLLYAFAGLVNGEALKSISSSNSPYPYVIAFAATAGIAQSRPRWKTPVFIVVSYLLGFLASSSLFSVVTMYSVAAKGKPADLPSRWSAWT